MSEATKGRQESKRRLRDVAKEMELLKKSLREDENKKVKQELKNLSNERENQDKKINQTRRSKETLISGEASKRKKAMPGNNEGSEDGSSLTDKTSEKKESHHPLKKSNIESSDSEDSDSKLGSDKRFQQVDSGEIITKPSKRIYFEKARGFQRIDQRKLLAQQREWVKKKTNIAGEKFKTPIDLSICLQSFFDRLSYYIGGLLAGMALLHLVMIATQSLPPIYFYQSYVHFALPFHKFYQLLLIICTVAALDRIDLGSSSIYPGRNMWSLLLFLYPLALVLSLSVEPATFLISHGHFHGNSTPYELLNITRIYREEVTVWRNMHMLADAGIVLCWIFIAFYQPPSYLLEFLNKIKSDIPLLDVKQAQSSQKGLSSSSSPFF